MNTLFQILRLFMIILLVFTFISMDINVSANISLKEKRKKSSKKKSSRFQIPKCKSKSVLFSVSPIDTDDLSHIVPLGNVSAPFHVFPVKHIYFHMKRINENSQVTEIADIFSPGDIWVTTIESMSYLDNNNEIENEDYRLVFSPCREVQGYFIHLTSISDKLKKEFKGQKNCSEAQAGDWRWISCSQSANIKLKAGEFIGTAGGDFTNAFDLGLSDYRKQKINYANPSRWKNKDDFFTVCPLDYFQKKEKEKLESFLGTENESSKINPICGTVDQDIKDTAQGNWFVKGTMIGNILDEDPQLALVKDNIDPTKEVFSIGTSLESLGISAGTYEFSPQDSGLVNRHFKDISDDENTYCFETQGKNNGFKLSLLVKLNSSNKLLIRKNTEDSCNTISDISSSFIEFER